jgi:phosphatidylinositol-3-phosphatase
MAAGVTSCPACEAPVVPDQRYCLSCGTRVGERRLDPLALLRSRRAAAAATPTAPELPEAAASHAGFWRGAGWAGFWRAASPRTLAASCLGLLLGGALIGAAFAPGPAGSLAAAAGQIVVVGSATSGGAAQTGGPTASFAPSGPVTPLAPAPSEPAGPAPAAPVEPVPEPDEPVTEPPADTPAEPEPEKPSIGHVYLVVLPGAPGAEVAFGTDDDSAPAPGEPPNYLRDELVPQGQLLTEYKPVGTSALSNRLALISGQEPTPDTEAGCPDYEKCLFPPEAKTLADQLSTWGLEWRAYVDGMEEPCRRPDPLDPFVYFHSVVDLATCSQYVLPLDELPPLDKPDKQAVFNLVALSSPDQLETWLGPLLDSKPYRKDGLVVILFDNAPKALVLSPFVDAGATNDKPYDSYSLLKTVEERIGVGEHLGKADDRKVRAFGSDVFNTELDPLQQLEGQ